uniref:Uncharacterized protein n=1 Tax=Quercus lobata TaxID=97700 RepID=A0A7N2LF04_QUELO
MSKNDTNTNPTENDPENTFRRDNSKKKTYVEATVDAIMHETLYEEEEEEENDDGDNDTMETETRGSNIDQPGDEEQFNKETWEINVSTELKRKMASPWQTGIIIKLMGKQLGYRALQKRITIILLWMDHGLWEISISMSKHGKLIFTPEQSRPKLHDTNTNTNRPGAPAITLTNGESSSPKHESHAHATLSPSRPLTPPGLPQPPNELPFHRNLEQRGSDICLYSNPSTDVGCLESDDPNSQLASSGRLNHSPLPKEERQVPCTSPTSGTTSMKASTSSTATHTEEYARRLQQCNVSGNTAKSHFRFLDLSEINLALREEEDQDNDSDSSMHHSHNQDSKDFRESHQ